MLVWILIVTGLIIALYFVKQYCQLVSKREGYKRAFLQLEQQLVYRYQLLTALLEQIDDPKILKPLSLAHQSATQATKLAKVSIGDAVPIAELITAEALLADLLEQMWQEHSDSTHLTSAHLASENQALENPSIDSLKKEISKSDARINEAKQAYNKKVAQYNQFRLPQPNKLIANFYRFNPATPFND